ncbi:hypothetical protein M8C21_026313 [Ambrosia artemisiifolia]|uniref:C2 domain-containing protein n=1 Tax=Ambrosia artemisiifolia TaxID=4212 RepID=A0AAD5D162_AMBAR|nr:hypothetical protein M8C21_026313 [Ambrosia artemisiifolia]
MNLLATGTIRYLLYFYGSVDKSVCWLVLIEYDQVRVRGRSALKSESLVVTAKMATTVSWAYSSSSNGSSHAANDQDRIGDSRPHDPEPATPQSLIKMGSRGVSNMEDPDGTLASIAQCIEQLRQSSLSAQDKEYNLRQLLELIDTRGNAFSAVGSHSQAVPVLVSLLRSGTLGVKMQAATVLGSLCKENELRVKVLLGGCIPPLLSLLKSTSVEGRIAAAKTIYAVSQGGAKDHVGSKIFSTEGVVPVLWKQLEKGLKGGHLVDDLLTGALRNLCSSTEGFWSSTIQAGGEDILVKLLTAEESSTQANVCFLLASMMMEDASVCNRIIDAEATKLLLKLLGPGNEASVRAQAAAALKSLSAQCKEARKEITSSNGIPSLINATIAPSKEFMQGEHAQALQENAMCALANISGGLSYVISSLGQSLESCTSPAQIADTLGALASALMIYDIKAETNKASDPTDVELTLIKHEDIRECVESADAVPALLWLLKNGSSNGKEIASKTLNHLIHKSDTTTISQLNALLTSDLPESKVYVLDALKSLLSAVPLTDLLREGSASNDAIETIIKILSSTKEETRAKSASALAGIFNTRKDLRESSIAVKTLCSVMKLLSSESEYILAETSGCLAAIFLSIRENRDMAAVARDALTPLLTLANSSVVQVAEQSLCALANLLLDPEVSENAVPEDFIMPATRILHEGNATGRTHAAAAIARLLDSRQTDSALTDYVNRSGTVLALVSFIKSTEHGSASMSEALNALAILSRLKGSSEHIKPAWTVLAEYPDSISPIVSCIAGATPLFQDKAIEILSRLCHAQCVVLGNAIISSSACTSSIANRVIHSSNATLKIGGTALLVCATKVNIQSVMENLHEVQLHKRLIQSLVSMVTLPKSSHLGDMEDKRSVSIRRGSEEEIASEKETCTSVIYGTNIAIWLLSEFASNDDKSKVEIVEAGAVEILTERISHCLSQYGQFDVNEDSSIWICALLLAILFQDRDIIRANTTIKAIPTLASLLRSEESANRYFAAQATASLVCNGSRGTLLSVANSGAAVGLISLLGCADADIHDLLGLSEEFSLVPYPEQVALERLFRVDDIRVGATSRKAIPALVDLLKPIPDRPGAPFLALGLLIQLGNDCPSNKIVMVECGVLEALTRYLSLGPQEATEAAATDLLGILFSTAEIRRHESAFGAVSQLIAVLRMGGRGARYSAAKALENVFCADHIRNADSARQAVQPLVEVLNTGLEKERHAAIAALVRLLSDNPSGALAVADVEMNAVDVLCRILSSDCSMDLKVAAHGAIIPLVGLLYGRNYMLHEACSRALVKLGKDRPSCKMEMVKAGVIESVLDILHEAPPDFLCAAFAELLRILTNNATIAKGPSAAKVVEPLFLLLTKAEFGPDGQHSALQVLVNILEHPQCRADYSLTSHQAIEPLIPLLDSHVPAVQQLSAELLSHLLLEEHYQKDPISQQVIGPLMRVLGSGIPILQQRAVKALVSIAVTWPNEIAKEGGVAELSKVILLSDPSLPHTLWESAAAVLSGILQFSSEFYLEVPIAVLVRLLRSGSEATVIGALNALLVLESDDSSSSIAMAESGAIDALLELLRAHQCEDTAARLLEALLNNVKIRETKATKLAILPLSQYLLDPQTQAQQARLLATLALGDLFQNETLARSSDAVSACRALVNVLEDQPSEEMKVVAICALQNLVMYSRSNKRAVAEAGGVQVVLDLIGSSDTDTSVQSAMFVKLLFSNNTIQEYASSETVRAITAAIEKDLWATGTVNEEYLKALNALFGNFPRLRATEPATLSIPHLLTSLKTGSEATQEAALDALFLLRQAWSACPADVSRSQSNAAADAIPLLQYLIQSGPPRFQEKAELLLQCLPGTLTVIIKRGNNMKQSVGNPSAYCKLTLGNTPSRQTKVVSTGPNPEWDESFVWSFESPPKGQKLHISCKNKSKMGKSSFGKVTIQIDRVVMLGVVAGEYTLLPESKSGASRNLEIEFQWSNK